jgi:UDP-N-acetylglucosamine 1-carboxyvinyltransferase
MGADIVLTNACLGSKLCRYKDRDHLHSAIIRGIAPLHGQPFEIPDLRAGFAYLIAALVADGTSELTNIRYMERGYARLPEKLESIGATIKVVDHPREAV